MCVYFEKVEVVFVVGCGVDEEFDGVGGWVVDCLVGGDCGGFYFLVLCVVDCWWGSFFDDFLMVLLNWIFVFEVVYDVVVFVV